VLAASHRDLTTCYFAPLPDDGRAEVGKTLRQRGIHARATLDGTQVDEGECIDCGPWRGGDGTMALPA